MRVPHPTPFLQDTSYFRQVKRLASAETMAYPTYMNKVGLRAQLSRLIT